MWKGRSVSVILMTYAEKESIRGVIEGFEATGVVDEIVVVNNNAQEGTAEEVARTGARQVFETKQGYGHATRRGLAEARGDLLVIAEPDGTFMPSDIGKLLAYTDDCDAVFGTRTTSALIWRGANMGWFLKWGNWAVAKLVEVLFNTSHLSDVGCTYKAYTRQAYERIEDRFTVGGSHFGPELMLLTITSGVRFVEVPINYLPRVGKSSVTGDFHKTLVLGLQMIGFILRFRLKAYGRIRRPQYQRPTEQSPASQAIPLAVAQPAAPAVAEQSASQAPSHAPLPLARATVPTGAEAGARAQ